MSCTVYIRRGEPELSFIRVEPGEWVVVKPNLVKDADAMHPLEWQSVVTSGELIRQVCAHVAKQLAGRGRITVCDGPQTDSSFERIVELLGLGTIAREISAEFGVPVEVVDLRSEVWKQRDEVVTSRHKLPGDPAGTIAFNLGRDSYFYGHPGEGRYYGADYDARVVNGHHRADTQEYLLCASPINADVFINMPKLKTHRKTGVTLNLKNLVGINADKNWLPHHTDGSPDTGGDQFPNLTTKRHWEQRAVSLARQLALSVPGLGPLLTRHLRKAGKQVFGTKGVTRSGNWYGNNTCWRMVLDLNRCLLYGNPDGTLRRTAPKRYYSVIDGIIGMDGDGPIGGNPVHSQLVITGADPVMTDLVAARVMGFDWRKLPMIREALKPSIMPLTPFKLEDVEVVSDVAGWSGRFVAIESREFLHFRPHFGWQGHVEYQAPVNDQAGGEG